MKNAIAFYQVMRFLNLFMKPYWFISDGTKVPVEISISRIPYENDDALLVITRDITLRKKQQAEREKTMALLQATIEHANTGILVIDAQQNVLAHNRKFLEIWKMPADWARIAYPLLNGLNIFFITPSMFRLPGKVLTI